MSEGGPVGSESNVFSQKGEKRRREAVVLSFLRKIEARNMLDVGCYDGQATMKYAEACGISLDGITGIEPQERYGNLVQFTNHTTDVERETFPFPDQAFDLVVCNQVLEHLKVVIAPLREMVRVLAVGGHLLLGIPNMASLISRLYLLLGRDPICLYFPGPHIRGFTHKSFLHFLRRNPNLRIVATVGSTLYPFPPDLFERAANTWPGLACYTFYLLVKEKHDVAGDWPAGVFPVEEITG